MKSYHLLAIAFLLFAIGCDKDDPAPPAATPEEVLKKEVADVLAAENDLGDFVEAFKELQLQPAEIAEGITIFAPASGNSGGRMRSDAQAAELTPEILKGHIIKGLIESSELNDGDTFEALDGRSLIVSVDGDQIAINGVVVSGKDLANSEGYVIHKVQEIIGDPVDETASITVTVWNALKWSPADPKGKTEPGVSVAFYTSREHYAEGDAVFSGETNQSGQLTFPSAEAGTNYLIVAQKGALSNIFYRSAEPSNGVYTGFVPEGIFQTNEEVQNAPFQTDGAPGNFRWLDLNGDAIINNHDKTFIPHEEVEAVAGGAQVEVIIGYDNNDAMSVRDGDDALATLQSARNKLNSFHKTLVMTDGTLSDDADCSGVDASWCMIDNFTLTPSNPIFLKIWNDGYNTIADLNLLLRDVPGLTFAEKSSVLAEATGLRAYVYLQLGTYFGGVPIPEDLRIAEGDARKTIAEVHDFVGAELQSVVNDLPLAPSGNRDIFTQGVAKTLLARLALLKGDYSSAESRTNEILQGAQYSLMINVDAAFADPDNAEIIWDFSYSLPAGFQEYFHGRTFAPAIRLAEIYLMNAEALIELNSFEAAKQTLDIVRARRSLSSSSGMTLEALRGELRETWRLEMSREGDRFVNLVRWQVAGPVLSAKGFNQNMHAVLPIPQLVMEQYYNIQQNPGY